MTRLDATQVTALLAAGGGWLPFEGERQRCVHHTWYDDPDYCSKCHGTEERLVAPSLLVDGRRVVELPATCPTCEGAGGAAIPGPCSWAWMDCDDCVDGLVSVRATVHELVPILKRSARLACKIESPHVCFDPDDKTFQAPSDGYDYVTLLLPDGVESEQVVGWWAANIELAN